MQTLLGAGDLIDRSAQLYKTHRRAILQIIIWNTLVSLIITLLDTALLARWSNSVQTTLLSLALTIPTLVVSLLTFILLVRYTSSIITGKSSDTWLSWRGAKKSFWKIAGLIIFLDVITSLGFLAFLIPGILFWVWFAFAPVLAVLEDKRWITALTESRTLSKEKFFPVLWRLAAPYIFFFLVQIVIILLTVFLLQGCVRGMWSIELNIIGAPLWFLLLVAGITDIIRSFLLPLFVFPVTLLSFALKETTTEPTA